MPFLGDAPNNPVPVVLTLGAGTGVATDASTHDRHICWFSIPAQAAGFSALLQAPAWADICMVWAGGTTAYYANDEVNGSRVGAVHMALPTGVETLVALIPRGVARPTDATVSGELSAGAAKTAAQWAAEFPADLTKRLPILTDLSVTVAATVTLPGDVADPFDCDFMSSLTPYAIDLSAWDRQVFAILVRVPAGYAVGVAADSGHLPDVECATATGVLIRRDKRVFKVAPNIWTVLTPIVGAPLPGAMMSISATRISDVSGSLTDTDGFTVTNANVMLLETSAYSNVVASAGGIYTFPDVTEGDYVAVAFNLADGRDCVAGNFTVPVSTRPAGGTIPPVIIP